MQVEKKRILIIDDSEYNVEVIGTQLAAEGYEVDKAFDGETGLRRVKEHSPDLILLDVMMPTLNGYDVCRILKEQEEYRFIPIILITALGDSYDKVKGLEAGADDFLVKPLNTIEMLARIKSLLRHRDLVEKQRKRDQYVAEISKLLDLEQLRREEETKRKQLYQEVIYAVTNGKLQLLEREELVYLRQNEQELGVTPVRSAEDIPNVRKKVETLAKDLGLDEERNYSLALCVSEAATNIIKHAESGTVRAARNGSLLRIWVEDTGPGIEYTNLSKAALMRGYSTKPSLGYGFTIMLECLDSLFLCTDQKGTTVVLEMNLQKESNIVDLDSFLSNWQEQS